MKQFYLILLVFLTVLSKKSIAQDPAYFVIGAKDFANIDIYSLLYNDDKDILYAGTNSGVYVYKQNRFIRIARSKDEIGSSFFQLQQNENGDIYCCNLNGQIFKIVNDKMILFHQIPSDEITIGFTFFFVENNNIISTSQSKVRKISLNGIEEVLWDQNIVGKINEKVSGSFLNPLQIESGEILFPISESEKLLHYNNGSLKEIALPFPDIIPSQLTIFTLEEKVIMLDREGKVRSKTREIPSKLKFNNAENLFAINKFEVVGLDLKKGMRILGFQNDTLIEKQSLFENEFISSVCSNTNGTFFLGSFGEGIKVIPNKTIIQANYDKHLFLSIATSPDNEVFVSTRGGEIFKYNKGLKLIDKIDGNIDHVYYLEGDFEKNDKSKDNIFYDSPQYSLSSVKDFCQLDSTAFVIAMSGNVALVTNDNVDIQDLHYGDKNIGSSQYHLFPPQRYASVTWSASDSVFYFANAHSVFARQWFSPEIDTILYKEKTFFANDLEYYDNQLICGTEKNGILLFKDKKNTAQLSLSEGLKSNTIKKVAAKDDLLYILSNAGIQVYDLKKRVFLGLGVAEGVVNSGVSDFAISKDKLWLMEKHRFYAIDIASFANSQKEYLIEKLYIDSILVNGILINHNEYNRFTYKENELNVFFDYRDLESKTETSIKYILEGFYENWKTIPSGKNNYIEFQSLPIGKYTFKIKATYRNQSTEPFVFAFEIVPPFWLRWWFYLFLMVLGILLATIIFRYKLNRQRKKIAIRNELNISKLAAIRSQMNPHFIFNALNSIQHLFLKGETDASYSFINKFAILVRKTLDFSEKEFISLDEEINLIEVYLTLEKLRFKDDFSFEIIKPKNTEINIPPMLIQPFIENAILHGLFHKKGKKRLRVNFEFDKNLICIIEDNGIGREKAKEIRVRQKGNHKPFSLRAIKKRFAILSDYYEGDLGYEYLDFLPTDNQDITTRVLLTIPIQSVRKN